MNEEDAKRILELRPEEWRGVTLGAHWRKREGGRRFYVTDLQRIEGRQMVFTVCTFDGAEGRTELSAFLELYEPVTRRKNQ